MGYSRFLICFSGDQASKISENKKMGKPAIGSRRSDEPYLERGDSFQ